MDDEKWRTQLMQVTEVRKVANVYSPTVHVNVIFIAEEKEEHVTATELNRQNLLHVLKIEHAFTLS